MLKVWTHTHTRTHARTVYVCMYFSDGTVNASISVGVSYHNMCTQPPLPHPSPTKATKSAGVPSVGANFRGVKNLVVHGLQFADGPVSTMYKLDK